jgi:four helix bundle protein
MKSFRDLRVWKAGMALTEEVYRLTQKFPRYETYGLTIQTRRAAISIPSNIAEGHTDTRHPTPNTTDRICYS